ESITELPPFWIDGKISMETMQTLLEKRSEYAESYRDMDPYDMEFVLHHPDFLRLINLRYMAHFARELGVKTKLPNKLSLVLGAIDVSLNEMNQLYAGILNGSMYQLKDWSRPYMIDKIFTADGDLIYQAKPEKKDVVDPLVGAQVANIMHSVFQNGTAKNKVVKLDGYRVPAIGKTGTTTSNVRAAFCGMLPREYAGLWSIEDGIVISSYVGFDQNREMKRNKVQITGSSGALPFWVDTAQAIADRDLIGSLSKEVPWRPQEPLYEQPTKLEYLKYGKLRVEESQNWFYSEDNDYLERNLYRLYVPVNSERTILKKEPFEMEDTEVEEEETGD
ncbi:MAG: penicillin-binding transpeptidase domain-containing protein, partial [Myxococcota bacterium]|nr:penicillin-binding transpeptidase domain-containing protein [Myxococcota bacterium]